MNIAVVGAGVAGLSAAWLLSRNHRVTLVEKEGRLGGHSNTHLITQPGQAPIPVDTGFIAYNTHTYPNLAALFDHLGVATRETRMSFSVSVDRGRYEYAGSFVGLFGNAAACFSPGHWAMVRDIIRFSRCAAADVATLNQDTTLGEYLACNGYSSGFIDRHILPMASAIWSSDPADIRHHPARAFLDFFRNHGLLNLGTRPPWRTVTGGSQAYVSKLCADALGLAIISGDGAKRLSRNRKGCRITLASGRVVEADHVVLACHAPEAMALIEQPTEAEREILGQFRTTRNVAILHRDPTFMPKRRRFWSSWNYTEPQPQESCTVTYWMNNLQMLPDCDNVFVTLNPGRPVAQGTHIARFDCSHPLPTPASLAAQQELWLLQGVARTWFAGAWFGAGFHEDGLQAGLAVAEALGGRARPWSVPNQNGRICWPDRQPAALAA